MTLQAEDRTRSDPAPDLGRCQNVAAGHGFVREAFL